MQKISHSVTETILNVGSGALISFFLNILILPMFVSGIQNSLLETSIIISIIFTSVSMGRSFIFRRFFTRFTEKKSRAI